MGKNYRSLGMSVSITGLLTTLLAAPLTADNGTLPLTWSAKDFERPAFLDVLSLPVTKADGKPIDIAAQPGWKVVYFWSAECPCVKACEDFTLVPLAKKYAGQVTFYAVAANGFDLAKSGKDLQVEVDAHKLPYSVYLDRSHDTTRALGAEVTPEAFLLDPNNNVVFSGMPDDSKRFLKQTGKRGITSTYLSRALDEALAGKPVSHPHTEFEGCVIAW